MPTDRDRGDPAPSLLSMLPRRNLRRALFLFVALLAVLAIKYSGGTRVGGLFDSVAPPPTAPGQPTAPGTLRLQVVPSQER